MASHKSLLQRPFVLIPLTRVAQGFTPNPNWLHTGAPRAILRFRINIFGGRRGRFFTGVSIAWTSVGGDFWTISGAAKEWPPCYFGWLEFAGQTMRTTGAQFVAAPAAANKKSPVVVAASKYLQNFPLVPNTVPANWRWWGGCSYKCIDRSWVSFCISTLNRSYGQGVFHMN